MGERRQPKHTYAWLQRNHYPDGFCTLCYNCCNSYEEYDFCTHQTTKISAKFVRRQRFRDGHISLAEQRRLELAKRNKDFCDREFEAWKKNPEDPIGQMLEDEENGCVGISKPDMDNEMLDTLSDMHKTHTRNS